MRAPTERVPSWVRQPIVLGLLGVLVLGVAYPPLADPTQQPLTIFVIPILLVSAFGSWVDTLVVGAVALVVALIEGSLQDEFDAAGLAARISIVGVCWALAILLAFERGRRQKVVEASRSQSFLLDVFQDSLVPEPVPPAGVVVHTRYLPGDERLQLGGDFFDAIRLPNGSLGYVIGDVCGQGPRAAAFGAAVRSGWKTLATTVPDDPHHWVQGLDDTFFRLGRHADTYVTLNTGFIELESRRWCFVSAGHPWPVLVHHDVDVVKPIVGPPVGIGLRSAWEPTNALLPIGAVILLYTDGLIENALPGQPKDNDGDNRLLTHLRQSALDIDDLLHTFGPDGFDDDVAVMTIAVG